MPVDLNELLGKAYSLEEAAKLLNISTEARRLVRRGLLKANRPPARKSYVVLGEDIVLYLTSGEGTPAMKEREAARVTKRLGRVLETTKPTRRKARK